MGITKDFLRFNPVGRCNLVGSVNGMLEVVDQTTVAVTTRESVAFYNMRRQEQTGDVKCGDSIVSCIKFTSDRSTLIIGYEDGSIRLFSRREDAAAPVSLVGHKSGVNCLALSTDNVSLASGGKDSTIVVWDVVGERGLFKLHGHKDSVTCVQFVRDDKFIVSSSKDSFIKFWSVETQNCFYTIIDHTSEIYSFALVHSESLLISASAELELVVFSLQWLSDTDAVRMEDDADEQKQAKRNPLQGAAEGDDAQANRYLKCVRRGRLLRQGKGRALQLALSPDQRLLACIGSNSTADVFRIYSPEEAGKRVAKKLRKAKRTANDVDEAVVRQDISALIGRVGDWRPDVKPRWISWLPDLANAAPTDGFFYYRFAALMANNDVVDCTVRMDAKSSDLLIEPRADLCQLGHHAQVRCLALSSDGRLASASADSLFIWSTRSIRSLQRFDQFDSEGDDEMKKKPTKKALLENDVTSILWATGEAHLLVGTKTGTLWIWDVSSNSRGYSVPSAHTAAIWALCAFPDRSGFISASADRTLRCWNYALVTTAGPGRRQLLTVAEQRRVELDDEALCAAISPDSRFYAVGLLNSTASIYFADSLKLFLSLYGHSLPVTAIHISPDNKLVATGSADKSVRIWGLDFGDCHRSLHAHDDTVTGVLFTPGDERLLWSCGRDGRVRRWEAKGFVRVQALDTAHSGPVVALAQSTDGRLISSAGHDNAIGLWEESEEILVVAEEEEEAREAEYEQRLADQDDEAVVVGEDRDSLAVHLAARKTLASVTAAESLIESIQVAVAEKAAADDPTHTPHPLVTLAKQKGLVSLDHFVVDTLARVRPADLETALLLVPLSCLADLLRSLAHCARLQHRIELCARTALFLIRVHHSFVLNSVELVDVVRTLKEALQPGVTQARDVCGLNLAVLRLLKLEVEDRDQTALFSTSMIKGAGDKGAKKNKRKKRKAILRTVV